MGKSRADYMREYRQRKREEKLRTEGVKPKKVFRNSTQRNRDFRARIANSILSSIPTASTSTATPNIVVNHATLRPPSLTFDMGPSTSSAFVSNIQPAEVRPCPFEAEQETSIREDVEQTEQAADNSTVRQYHNHRKYINTHVTSIKMATQIKSIRDSATVCRICLSEINCSHNIFTEKCSNDETYSRVLMKCTPIKIAKDDGLSQRICETCICQLESFVICGKIDQDFISKCIDVNMSSHNDSDSIYIKTEDGIDENTSSSQGLCTPTEPVKMEYPVQDLLLCDQDIKKEPLFEMEEIDIKMEVDELHSQYDIKNDNDSFKCNDPKYNGGPQKKASKKLYECIHCKKMFSRSYLKTHMLRHSREKPHKCHLCTQSYNHITTLTAHLRAHAENKIYEYAFTMPRSNADRVREHRARKKLIETKNAPKTAAERCREYRARKKLSNTATVQQNHSTNESTTSVLLSQDMYEVNHDLPSQPDQVDVHEYNSSLFNNDQNHCNSYNENQTHDYRNLIVGQVDAHDQNSSLLNNDRNHHSINDEDIRAKSDINTITKSPPKTVAERCREYRARKYGTKTKRPPKTVAERSREYRARQKILETTVSQQNQSTNGSLTITSIKMATQDSASVCRICLSEIDCSHNIFTEKCSNDETYSHVLMKCTAIKIAEDDGLSQGICETCICQLESFVICGKIDQEFISKCIDVNMSLHNDLDSIYIKTEDGIDESTNSSQGWCTPTEPVEMEYPVQDLLLCNQDIKKEPLFEMEEIDIKMEVDELHSQCDIKNDDDSFKSNDPKYNGDLQTKPSKKLNECIHCKKTFSRRSNLKTHMLTHSQEKPHKCTLCTQSYNHKTTLTAHLLAHAEKKIYECNECGKGYFYKYSLKVHKRIHMPNDIHSRPYKCNQCDQTFKQKSHLTVHFRTHTQEKKYACDLCEKTFNHKYGRMVHMRTHTKDRPHECTLCTKTFSQKSSLITHLRVHTRDKKHKCSLCEKAFVEKSNLKKHMLVHTQNRAHLCDQCGKGFNLKSGLMAHKGSHTRARPYKCDRCDNAYTTKANMLKHFSKQHDGALSKINQRYDETEQKDINIESKDLVQETIFIKEECIDIKQESDYTS